MRFAVSSPERAECVANLAGEQLRLFPGGEVTALVDLVEVREVGVGLLDPTTWSLEDLAGEGGEGGWDRDRRWNLAGRLGLGLSALPVRAGGRGTAACQPVERDVVDDVVAGEVASGLPVNKGVRDLLVAVRVMVEHPGGQGHGRIQKGVADGLRPRGLLQEVAEAGCPEAGQRIDRRLFLLAGGWNAHVAQCRRE